MTDENERAGLEERLKALSKEIWGMRSDRDYYELYIDELLPCELDYIRTYGKLPEKTGGTLIFLLGYSLEPLFLTLCLRKPDDVILVMNDTYGENSGEGYYYKVIRLLELLQNEYRFNVLPFQEQLNSDSPHDVFEFLQKHCPAQEDVYIDITGGKKSMIAGAFFYAAYSNTPITYVDFADYDYFYQRPYGYSCHMEDLPNPMKEFSLREWENAKAFYESYSFGSALGIIRSLGSLGNKGLTKQQRDSIQNLDNVITLYDYWNYSDYEKAKKLIDKGDVILPGSKLPSILGQFQKWNIKVPIQKMDYLLDETTDRDEVKRFGERIYSNMFNDPALLYFYIKDEIHKVVRLIGYVGDFRSAVLKAASTSEILMRMRLWMIADAIIGWQTTRENFRSRVDSIDMATMLRIFRGEKAEYNQCPLSVNYEHKCLSLQKRKLAKSTEQIYVQFQRLLVRIDYLALIRNKVVHGFMPASKSLADKAEKIASDSLAEFSAGWMTPSQREAIRVGIYEIIPWSELRDVCHLDFIPEVK